MPENGLINMLCYNKKMKKIRIKICKMNKKIITNKKKLKYRKLCLIKLIKSKIKHNHQFSKLIRLKNN